ncbi:hypothetical protein M1615_02670 [Patescibacteria group bacterium]|nr:hypothetical protein [Patescibacteria group bacterium]
MNDIGSELPPVNNGENPHNSGEAKPLFSNIQSAESAAKESQSAIVIGAEIAVKRSGGDIEGGWRVDSIDPKTGRVFAQKGDLSKDFDKSELDRYNMPPSLGDIQNASSRQELFYFLNRLGGIQGSSNYFSSQELEGIISQVLEHKSPLESITRTGGLRDRVEQIMKVEEKRREIQEASKG